MAKKKEVEQKTNEQIPREILPVVVEKVGSQNLPAYATAKQEYEVEQHKVFSTGEHDRPKRKKRVPVLGHDGAPLLDDKGKPQTTIKLVDVNRIGVPLQKLIVKRRVAFMNVGKIQLEANPVTADEQRLYDIVKFIRDDNKIEFIEKEIARRLLSELQVAKLWYSEPIISSEYWGALVRQGGNFRMRCKVLSPELGDTLLPVFDDFGKMVYFGRQYKSKPGFSELVSNTELLLGNYSTFEDERFDVYSDRYIYKFRKARPGETVVSTPSNNGWIIESVKAHSYGKIPVIYYSKPAPPWADVQSAIDRIEALLSDIGETNIYHASPIFAMFGDVSAKMLERGDQGKALQIKGEKGEAKYITWDQATDAIKLEMDNLMRVVFEGTQTAQMSMEDLKGLGAASGVAYDRIFMDPHLAARDEIDGEYGLGTKRDINFLTTTAGVIDTSLSAVSKRFNIGFDVPIYRINDDGETLDVLIKAKNNKLLSQKTAVEYSPLTKNADDEIAQIKAETQEEMDRQSAMKPAQLE
ncbi:phage portal protein [Sphingobacterium suaedae]|uniref:Phage portal protein n=1 Tax=Sphingobacterium suaedae TaxID=1686402 RepID=A0ABW5KFE9_9SPHI